MSDSWDDVLGRLVADLDDAERRLDAQAAPAVERWTPPADLGPLPERLLERAVAVLSRQGKVAERLDEARTAAGRHLAALDAIPARRQGAALYLDVTG
ncbi:hypothetical protein [Sinomonas albida]|uniref:hypothetical protein n=1 Tax=Sinomonas albida TaxID=369942 RepID=UPI003019EA57